MVRCMLVAGLSPQLARVSKVLVQEKKPISRGGGRAKRPTERLQILQADGSEVGTPLVNPSLPLLGLTLTRNCHDFTPDFPRAPPGPHRPGERDAQARGESPCWVQSNPDMPQFNRTLPTGTWTAYWALGRRASCVAAERRSWSTTRRWLPAQGSPRRCICTTVLLCPSSLCFSSPPRALGPSADRSRYPR